MSNDFEKRIRRLEVVLTCSVIAWVVCVLLVFAHLMHDYNEFGELWKAIAELKK